MSSPVTVSNREMAALFDELADLLAAEGTNPFRIRAYRAAARLIAVHPQRITDLLAAGQDLTKLPGIGEAIAKKIQAIAETENFASSRT